MAPPNLADELRLFFSETYSLYAWIKRYDPQQPNIAESYDPSEELAKLKRTATCYRRKEYSKKGRSVLHKPVQMSYTFIQDNQRIWSIRRLCSTLDVHHSGYYAHQQ